VYSIVSNETITVQSVVLSAGGTTSSPNTSAVITPQTASTTNSSGTTSGYTSAHTEHFQQCVRSFDYVRDGFAALLLWHVAV
jgi:hypothetical protein